MGSILSRNEPSEKPGTVQFVEMAFVSLTPEQRAAKRSLRKALDLPSQSDRRYHYKGAELARRRRLSVSARRTGRAALCRHHSDPLKPSSFAAAVCVISRWSSP